MADKEGQKIAVEVKSFIGHSETKDLELALGQFALYHAILEDSEPARRLFLAIPKEAHTALFTEPIGLELLRKDRLRLIVFEPDRGVILQWIPSPT